MQEYIKQREMIDWGRMIEHRVAIRNLPQEDYDAIKDFQKQTIIGLLEQECERLEKMKKDEGSKNLSDTQIAINWANPMYNLALQDQINYYQQQIKTLKEK